MKVYVENENVRYTVLEDAKDPGAKFGRLLYDEVT